MTVFGVTGGVGMGKSTSARLLEQRRIPVVDTDQLAREVVEPGEPALQEVAAAFCQNVIGPDGRLRRDELARIVFADPVKRQQLESILHPRIRQRWKLQIEQWKREGCSRCVVVIPLLYETGADAHFDAVICVACSSASQRRRLQSRDWTSEQIDQRLAAQWSVQKKMDLANYVVWTEAGIDTHAAQLARIMGP